jgi:hypothetical protein
LRLAREIDSLKIISGTYPTFSLLGTSGDPSLSVNGHVTQKETMSPTHITFRAESSPENIEYATFSGPTLEQFNPETSCHPSNKPCTRVAPIFSGTKINGGARRRRR